MSDAYERDSVFVQYLKWHYTKGLQELFGVASNFLWFVSHFFSFNLLLKTLFAPWRRLGEAYDNVLTNLEGFASALVVNTLMRVVGFCTKIVVIAFGLVTYFLVFLLSFFILVIWVLAPFVILGSAILSVTFFAI